MPTQQSVAIKSLTVRDARRTTDLLMSRVLRTRDAVEETYVGSTNQPRHRIKYPYEVSVRPDRSENTDHTLSFRLRSIYFYTRRSRRIGWG
jgi:hypothetical protein